MLSAGAEVVYITDLSAGLQALHCFRKSLYTAACNHYLIHALAVRHIQNLLVDRTILVTYKVSSSISLLLLLHKQDGYLPQ